MERNAYGMMVRLEGERTMDEAIAQVTAALKEVGFGVLTRIDVKETFRAKLDVDFRPYVILGACNPHLAHEALTAEPQLGLLLPCNVVVQEHEDGIEVSFVRPDAMFSMVDNPELNEAAGAAGERLEQALVSLTEG